MTKLLLGADPEVFVRKKGAKRFFLSAHGMNEGTKEAPVKVKDGAVQVDGMALEFNIDPAETPKEFADKIFSVLGQLEEALPEGLEIVATPVAHFSKKHLEAQPEEAKELGCNPDYNAWTGKQNPRPNGKNITFRTGAGHIHFGWTNGANVEDPNHIKDCEILVRALDNILAPACALFDPGVKRRVLYGKAGAYRPKPYGCEYRVLSNAWLMNKELAEWVAIISTHVFNMLCRGLLSKSATQQMYRAKYISKKELSNLEKMYVFDFLDFCKLPRPPIGI